MTEEVDPNAKRGPSWRTLAVPGVILLAVVASTGFVMLCEQPWWTHLPGVIISAAGLAFAVDRGLVRAQRGALLITCVPLFLLMTVTAFESFDRQVLAPVLERTHACGGPTEPPTTPLPIR